MKEYSEQEIQEWKKKIDGYSADDCLSLQRFAPAGHPVFRSDLPLYDYFKEHFDKLGGITPQLSKTVGWK